MDNATPFGILAPTAGQRGPTTAESVAGLAITTGPVSDEGADALLRELSEISASLSRGDKEHDAHIVTRGRAQNIEWVKERTSACFELLELRNSISITEVRALLRDHQAAAARGARVTMGVDHRGLPPLARTLLETEERERYFLGSVPLQLHIFDRTQIVTAGPTIDEAPTLMVISRPTARAAAYAYFDAARAASWPVSPSPETQALTARQRRIITLLDSGAADDQVARALGVAVRTVRKDVAALMQRFGVSTRFALGGAIARSIGEADLL